MSFPSFLSHFQVLFRCVGFEKPCGSFANYFSNQQSASVMLDEHLEAQMNTCIKERDTQYFKFFITFTG
ncbi:hypothetical protein CR203_05710 [Salipaludibacillus neizhouensis]|uniref:Uncharacterized protein n=1 Tax=Salipaludibacillus neizhouensis TaxID=885475 RepID=A0A3A9KB65_9BACI|nr:hypothetical protein CR203_05710 [Salipaludibacillus neizhouensis]